MTNTLSAVVRELRPRQWTKNLAALAPLLFARALGSPDAILRAVMAVISFCLFAGGVYVLNDWLDRDRDRLHPEKKKRPIASGELSPAAAAVLLFFCWLNASLIAFLAQPALVSIGLSYVALQIAYSYWLKHVVILDVVVIAIGFILRVVGGGVAIGVPLSNWLYLCTLLLAVFLGFAKRRHELASLENATSHRAILSEYSIPFLDQLITISAASCILAYGLYTMAPETVRKFGSDGLKYTVPFVIYGIFRYLFLIHKRNAGGSPERVLLSDAPLILTLASFVTVAVAVLYRF